MKKVLVTGGTGRLGNVLVKELIKEDFRVRVFTVPQDKLLKSLDGIDVEIFEGNILDKPSIAEALEGIDIVFHLATKIILAPDKDHSVWNINVEGTRNIATLCLENKIERYIHCSSHHALKHKPYNLILDESRVLALDDKSVYHRAKAQAESDVLEMVSRGLNAIIVSPGTLLGPYDYEPSIFGQALIDLYNEKIPLLMEGLSDYSDVRDVVKGMIKAYEKGMVGERYLLTGYMLSMKELSNLVGEITEKKTPKTILPLWVMYMLLPFIQLSAKIQGKDPLFTKEMIKASQSNPYVSHEKAKRYLDYHPRDLKESFQDTFDWYKSIGLIS